MAWSCSTRRTWRPHGPVAWPAPQAMCVPSRDTAISRKEPVVHKGPSRGMLTSNRARARLGSDSDGIALQTATPVMTATSIEATPTMPTVRRILAWSDEPTPARPAALVSRSSSRPDGRRRRRRRLRGPGRRETTISSGLPRSEDRLGRRKPVTSSRPASRAHSSGTNGSSAAASAPRGSRRRSAKRWWGAPC